MVTELRKANPSESREICEIIQSVIAQRNWLINNAEIIPTEELIK